MNDNDSAQGEPPPHCYHASPHSLFPLLVQNPKNDRILLVSEASRTIQCTPKAIVFKSDDENAVNQVF